ncbi:MAG: leucyl/phenylalanyl-tRNA--protein transferase [Phycisphaerae bacterium]|nr:leucyl/phenylalanyl-tRNA--protein transferase [Phycisphaerae bacterium]
MEPLTPELLLSAYAQSVFPMGHGKTIRWYSPDPRAILPLDGFHIPQSLRQTYRSAKFEIRLNSAFEEVIRACGQRPDGTWITAPIVAAYCSLHRAGFAHSVEAWHDGNLAGGLYGVALGGAFFGESMFHIVRDASKVALVRLVETLTARGFSLLDVQFSTPHLRRFGVVEIARDEYLLRLAAALQQSCRFAEADAE